MGFAADVGAGNGFGLLGRRWCGKLIRITNPLQFVTMIGIPIWFKVKNESHVSSMVSALCGRSNGTHRVQSLRHAFEHHGMRIHLIEHIEVDRFECRNNRNGRDLKLGLKVCKSHRPKVFDRSHFVA